MLFGSLTKDEQEDITHSLIEQFPEGLMQKDIITKLQSKLGIGSIMILTVLRRLEEHNKIRKIIFGGVAVYKPIKEST